MAADPCRGGTLFPTYDGDVSCMAAQEICMSLLGLTYDLRFFYTPYHLLLSYKYNV
jgi:hypothetical protein